MRSGALIWISRRRRLTLDQTERTMNDSAIVIKFFTWTSLRLQVSDRTDIVFWFRYQDQTDRQTSCWAVRSEALRQQLIDSDGSLKAVWRRRLTLTCFFEPASRRWRLDKLTAGEASAESVHSDWSWIWMTASYQTNIILKLSLLLIRWWSEGLSCQSQHFTPFYCIN